MTRKELGAQEELSYKKLFFYNMKQNTLYKNPYRVADKRTAAVGRATQHGGQPNLTNIYTVYHRRRMKKEDWTI